MKTYTLHTVTMLFSLITNTMLSDSVLNGGVIFWSCVITQSTPKLLRTLESWMFSILMKPEATSSQVGKITQLTEFPWRSLPSMLSELVHYRHPILSARVITFVTITLLGFMSRITTLFPPALCDFYWSVLSGYPFWYIHTCIGHVSSVFSFTSVSFFYVSCVSL